MRFSSILLLVVVLCLTTTASFYIYNLFATESSTHSPLLSIEPDCVDIPEAVVGESSVSLVFTNNSPNRVATIVGSPSLCSGNCCYKPYSNDKILILPGHSVTRNYGIAITSPGPFDASIYVYTDEGLLCTYKIPIKGTATALTKVAE